MSMSRRGKPDRVPFEINWGAFTPAVMERYHSITRTKLPPEEYFDFDVRTVSLNATKKEVDFRKYFKEEIHEDVKFDEFGSGSVLGSQEHFRQFKYHPLEGMTTVEEIGQYEWPDIDADYRYEGIEDKVKEYHKRGYAVAADMNSTIFEYAWMIRGFEQMLIDFYEESEIIHEILEQITKRRIIQAQRYALTGVDIIRLGDDIGIQSGPLISKEIYCEFLKPCIKRIVEAAKLVNSDILVFMHSCGNVEDFIPEFIEEGIDIVNPIQPECNNLKKYLMNLEIELPFGVELGHRPPCCLVRPKKLKKKLKK